MAAPTPDNDKDGILDVNDKCPNDPEDKDGFEDADGCPDPDNDKDGILDVNDKCPNEPETINGSRRRRRLPGHRSSKGRQSNRRTEFRILEVDGQPVTENVIEDKVEIIED
jgi:hypothetical protein